MTGGAGTDNHGGEAGRENVHVCLRSPAKCCVFGFCLCSVVLVMCQCAPCFPCRVYTVYDGLQKRARYRRRVDEEGTHTPGVVYTSEPGTFQQRPSLYTWASRSSKQLSVRCVLLSLPSHRRTSAQPTDTAVERNQFAGTVAAPTRRR